MIKNKKIGFIGAGNMGEAITGALVKAQIEPSQIYLSDVSNERLKLIQEKYKVNIMNDNSKLFDECQIVILAVKPQIMDEVLGKIIENENYKILERKIVISIAAGITIEKIENFLFKSLTEKDIKNLPIVRVMPNTPALVQCGMSGLSFNKNVVEEDAKIARSIFQSMGQVLEFPEKSLDAVTAISGSGPAYVFYFIEAMIEAAKNLGFSKKEAEILTIETFNGSIKLLKQMNDSPEELRRKVTSPGGTTEAAIKVMEKESLKDIINSGIKAAENRAKELRN